MPGSEPDVRGYGCLSAVGSHVALRTFGGQGYAASEASMVKRKARFGNESRLQTPICRFNEFATDFKFSLA